MAEGAAEVALGRQGCPMGTPEQALGRQGCPMGTPEQGPAALKLPLGEIRANKMLGMSESSPGSMAGGAAETAVGRLGCPAGPERRLGALRVPLGRMYCA